MALSDAFRELVTEERALLQIICISHLWTYGDSLYSRLIDQFFINNYKLFESYRLHTHSLFYYLTELCGSRYGRPIEALR